MIRLLEEISYSFPDYTFYIAPVWEYSFVIGNY